MPFLKFPQPTGIYAVGQCDCMWKDVEGRKLVVRIFYPVSKKDAEESSARAPWLPETYGAQCSSYAEAYAKFMWRPGVNSAVIGTLGFMPLMYNVQTQTLADAPLAEVPHKLKPMIFSHGLGGSRSCYSAVCVDMASHGYFVVAPEHSDGSACLNVLPDKTVIEHKFVPNKAVLTTQPKRIPGGFTRSLVPHHQPRPMTQYEFRNRQIGIRVEEMILVADCLERLSTGTQHNDDVPLPPALIGKLSDNLDMQKLSAVGHSFGAATCIQACAVDDRFRACIAHDPWLFPLDQEVASGSLAAPTLFLNADTFDMLWPDEGQKVLCSLLVRTTEKGKESVGYGVNGTKHQNYSDFPLLAPRLTMSIGVSGSTDPEVSLNVIHRCDTSFLDHVLNGQGSSPWEPPKDVVSSLTPFEVNRWGGAYALDGGGCPVRHGSFKAAAFDARDKYNAPDIMDV